MKYLTPLLQESRTWADFDLVCRVVSADHGLNVHGLFDCWSDVGSSCECGEIEIERYPGDPWMNPLDLFSRFLRLV